MLSFVVSLAFLVASKKQRKADSTKGGEESDMHHACSAPRGRKSPQLNYGIHTTLHAMAKT